MGTSQANEGNYSPKLSVLAITKPWLYSHKSALAVVEEDHVPTVEEDADYSHLESLPLGCIAHIEETLNTMHLTFLERVPGGFLVFCSVNRPSRQLVY